MDRYQNNYYPQYQQNNTTGEHQYYYPMQYYQPFGPHTHNFENYPSVSSSSNWDPYYVPQNEVQYVSPYDNYEWRSDEPDPTDHWIGFVMPHGDDGGYQPVNIHQVVPHQQQHLPQASSSSSHHIDYINLMRYMYFDENSPPRFNINLPYHLEDEGLVVDLSPPPTSYDIWFPIEDLHSHPAPANVDISDETIEKHLKKKTYVSPTYLSSETSSSADDHDICVVCQAEYEKEEKIGALRCGHEYHVECIKMWLRNKNECPICRAVAMSLELENS